MAFCITNAWLDSLFLRRRHQGGLGETAIGCLCTGIADNKPVNLPRNVSIQSGSVGGACPSQGRHHVTAASTATDGDWPGRMFTCRRLNIASCSMLYKVQQPIGHRLLGFFLKTVHCRAYRPSSDCRPMTQQDRRSNEAQRPPPECRAKKIFFMAVVTSLLPSTCLHR